MNEKNTLYIVVPCYKEQEVLPETSRRLREKMRQFRSVCFGRFDLIRMFLEIQIQAAFADGSLHPNERAVLYVIAEELYIAYHWENSTDGYQYQISGDLL